MIDNRTTEILAAIHHAARCTPGLSALLGTVRTFPDGADRNDTSSKTAGERIASGEVNA